MNDTISTICIRITPTMTVNTIQKMMSDAVS